MLGHNDREQKENILFRPSVASATNRFSAGSPRAGKSIKPNVTMVDLFLSGEVSSRRKSVGADGQEITLDTVNGALQLIPDPLDVIGTAEKTNKTGAARRSSLGSYRSAGVQQTPGLQVQDYWKHFASLPVSWPVVRNMRTLQERFIREFEQYAHVGTPKFGERVRCLVFVVVSLDRVGIRSSATQDPNAKTGEVLLPGQCVVVDTVVKKAGVRYMRLCSGGWIFDRLNGQPIMTQLQSIEVGSWWYRVESQDFVETRIIPVYENDARSGWVMSPGEAFVVDVRCTIDDERFLLLKDGRGWIFEVTRGNDPMIVMAECDEGQIPASKEDGDIGERAKRSGVEVGVWQYRILGKHILAVGSTLTGRLLRPGENITVNMRAPANGAKSREVSTATNQTIRNRVWLRLSDGRGWIPKTGQQGQALVRFTGAGQMGKVASPADSSGRDQGVEDWMVGVT